LRLSIKFLIGQRSRAALGINLQTSEKMDAEDSLVSAYVGTRLERLALTWRLAIVRVGLALASAFRDDSALIDGLLELGRLHIDLGQWGRAQSCAGQARERAIRVADQFRMAQADYQLGCVYMTRKEFERARAALQAAVRVAKVQGKSDLLAAALLNRGFVEDELGRVEDALASWEQTVSVAKRSGDTRRHTMALMNLGNVVYRGQRYDDAARYWHLALDESQRVADRGHIAAATFSLALAAHQLGRDDEARRLLTESRSLFQRIGRPDLEARSNELLRGLGT
jgi:tetratricopeptide (TPR) repeat protein